MKKDMSFIREIGGRQFRVKEMCDHLEKFKQLNNEGAGEHIAYVCPCAHVLMVGKGREVAFGWNTSAGDG